ncbi:MAG: hypothetical protein ACLFPI_11830 [Desulfobacterales bacterium]
MVDYQGPYLYLPKKYGVLQPAPKSTDDAYTPRKPQNSGYFQCVQNHFEVLEMVWEERYQSRYGFFRPYVSEVIFRFLEC